jgi:hypothetical protein
MATVEKDFKVKKGLIVEGTTAKVNNYDVLTKKQDDQDYIVNLIGGTATSQNTPDTVVKRDVNGNFSAGTISADLTGDVTGTVSDISNHDTDDLSEGQTNKYYTDSRVKDVLTGATKTNISITNIAGELHITAENGVGDSTTDDLTEGSINKYYSDSLVDNHLSGGTGISYQGGTISADLGTGLTTDIADAIAIDRTTVDGWYDASGSAQDVQDNLDAHTGSSSVHGVTGNVVGTTDSQTLTNKTIGDVLTFNDGSNDSTIDVDGNNLYINANNDLTLSTANGDLVLNPDGNAYIGSASAGNEIATNSYVDNAVSGLNWKQAVNLLYDAAIPTLSGSGASQLIVDGHDPLGDADSGYRVLVTQSSDAGIYVFNSTGGNWTLTRSEDADAYTELVGAAVFVMEGTQYGQTSWVQSNHYLSSFSSQSWTQFSGTGSVVAGTGITVDGLEVSVDRTTVDTWYDAAGTASDLIDDHNVASGVHGVSGNIVGTSDSQTLTNKTIDASNNTLSNIGNSSLTNSSIDINGYTTSLGGSVTLDTDDISEGSNEYFTQTRARQSLSAGTAISYNNGTGVIAVDASQLDTDDIAEGITNHYFTDSRAKDAAGSLLNNSTQSNIVISYDQNTQQLTVTAEDGFAGHDTDDLGEGESNLYFTDARAINAIQLTTPNFVTVELDSVAKQVAATTEVATASEITAYSWAKSGYRTAKFLVKTAYGTHTDVAEVLLTLDTSDNIAITEYAMVGTNGSAMTISADVSGNDVRLRVATVNNNSVVSVVGTLLA